MKLPLSTPCFKTILSIIPLGLCFCALSAAEGGDRDPLFSGAVRPGLDYRTELSQGYLTVYSATDRFDDGGVPYYPHSSYSIYTIDGKLFKKVENHISSSDETPELVTLPVGSYVVEARSENEGSLRIHVVVGGGVRTVVNLDEKQMNTQKRLARAKHLRRLANR